MRYFRRFTWLEAHKNYINVYLAKWKRAKCIKSSIFFSSIFAFCFYFAYHHPYPVHITSNCKMNVKRHVRDKKKTVRILHATQLLKLENKHKFYFSQMSIYALRFLLSTSWYMVHGGFMATSTFQHNRCTQVGMVGIVR